MTEQEIDDIAQEIASDMISAARCAPLNEPVQFVTGNSYMPPLRSYESAERVWQQDENGFDFEYLVEGVESILEAANVALECPDYDNALYVVDLARFEYVEENDGETLNSEWKVIA